MPIQPQGEMPLQIQWIICLLIGGTIGTLAGGLLSVRKVEKLQRIIGSLGESRKNLDTMSSAREALVREELSGVRQAMELEKVKRAAAERLYVELKVHLAVERELRGLLQKVQDRRLKLLLGMRPLYEREVRELRSKLERQEKSEKPGEVLVLAGTGPGSAAAEMARMEGR